VNASAHYRSNLRDIFFNLFEVSKVQDTLAARQECELDEASAREALTVFEALCQSALAPSYATLDRSPPVLDASGQVRLPTPMKRAMDAFWEGGWHLFDVPPSLGGIGAPPSLIWAQFELLAGAQSSLAFILTVSIWARVLEAVATSEQKARYLPQMIARHWGAAMVLTEPDAGSDVGAGLSRARHVAGDEYQIEGTKRFITNGDYDHAENIVHLVLARPEGAVQGTKGLSMFIVPKYWVELDGSLGARNGFAVSKLEHKMGLRASVTCEVVYGADAPCRGLLVGNVHDGIRQMFLVIEQARMAIGVKSMSTLSTAYLNALAYAHDRVQGPALEQAANKDASRVPIFDHPDVKRMLLLQKSHAEGMRALTHFASSVQDEIELAGGHGHAPVATALNNLLLPLVKGYCSDRVYELLAVSLQTFGGSGFLQDYPIEQYIRDQKIDTLYEGTTHIQALDLLFRKVAKDGGATLRALLARVRATVDGDPARGAVRADDELTATRKRLGVALAALEQAYGTLLGLSAESVNHMGFQGSRLLMATADVVVGWLLTRHAEVAQRQREQLRTASAPATQELAFYTGKIASAQFFAREVLPNVSAALAVIEAADLSAMSLPAAAY
jgi:alkylation response protein AidB-like acyl-CoA dehydrogenase